MWAYIHNTTPPLSPDPTTVEADKPGPTDPRSDSEFKWKTFAHMPPLPMKVILRNESRTGSVGDDSCDRGSPGGGGSPPAPPPGPGPGTGGRSYKTNLALLKSRGEKMTPPRVVVDNKGQGDCYPLSVLDMVPPGWIRDHFDVDMIRKILKLDLGKDQEFPDDELRSAVRSNEDVRTWLNVEVRAQRGRVLFTCTTPPPCTIATAPPYHMHTCCLHSLLCGLNTDPWSSGAAHERQPC